MVLGILHSNSCYYRKLYCKFFNHAGRPRRPPYRCAKPYYLGNLLNKHDRRLRENCGLFIYLFATTGGLRLRGNYLTLWETIGGLFNIMGELWEEGGLGFIWHFCQWEWVLQTLVPLLKTSTIAYFSPPEQPVCSTCNFCRTVTENSHSWQYSRPKPGHL